MGWVDRSPVLPVLRARWSSRPSLWVGAALTRRAYPGFIRNDTLLGLFDGEKEAGTVADDVADLMWEQTPDSGTYSVGDDYAGYVAFGTAVNGEGDDLHGAGGLRFVIKYEGGALGEGGERYDNCVRLVRDL